MSDPIEFLKTIRPNGPWLLVAIDPDEAKQSAKIKALNSADEELLRKFIARHIDHFNLYFHPNLHGHRDDRKAKRVDIEAMEFLFVDVDPSEGEDFEEERQRILKLLMSPPGDIPVPSIVVDSGGGFQAYWRLEKPFKLDGTEAMADDIAGFNRQLEIELGGDNCHNLDRIMRLPGTWNIPDARKRKRGRVKRGTQIVQSTPSTFKLGQFLKAEAPGSIDNKNAKFDVSIDDVAPVYDLAALDEWGVSDHYKLVIANGRGEKPKEKDNSRSAWLFDAVCHLVRKGVDDNTIFSLITDKEWPISESVLEHRQPREYAIKQIARAKAVAAENTGKDDDTPAEELGQTLAEFNERYAVIEDVGGKTLILDEHDPQNISFVNFTDFKNRHQNQKVEVEGPKGEPRLLPAGRWWTDHPQRRQYRQVVFKPREEVKNAFNLWRGYTCNAKERDIGIFLGHIRDNICSGNEDHAEYLLNWVAHMYQKPMECGHVVVTLRGSQGTGKGEFVRAIGTPLGRHYKQVTQSSHLTGNFNGHLENCLLLFADEAVFSGDRKAAAVLKSLATEPTLMIERKGIDARPQKNFLHIIQASNDDHVVSVGAGDRRNFVLDVSDDRKQDREFFRKMAFELYDNGGIEGVLHYFLKRDIQDFDVRDVPKTNAWREQLIRSLDDVAAWWFEKLADGQLNEYADDGWPEFAYFDELHQDYIDKMQQQARPYRKTRSELGMFLAKIVSPKGTQRKPVQKVHENGKQRQRYHLPSLETCRRLWELEYGAAQWPEDVDDFADL